MLYPDAEMDLIVKKGLEPLIDFLPAHNKHYVFSKNEYKGLSGAWKFGRQIKKEKIYDLFFCLPDSLSSAAMGFATGARKRIGYKKEGRSILLTSSFYKKKGLHRVDEYLDLLKQYTGKAPGEVAVKVISQGMDKNGGIVININSEAASRRLPPEKAISIISVIRQEFNHSIVLIAGPKDAAFVNTVYNALPNKTAIKIVADASLPELASILESAELMLSTDSGPAHLANALGTHTIVLFGAGNEQNTAPYNKDRCTVIRLGQLPCEPCVSNTCKKFGVPECLLRLDETLIVNEIAKHLSSAS